MTCTCNQIDPWTTNCRDGTEAKIGKRVTCIYDTKRKLTIVELVTDVTSRVISDSNIPEEGIVVINKNLISI